MPNDFPVVPPIATGLPGDPRISGRSGADSPNTAAPRHELAMLVDRVERLQRAKQAVFALALKGLRTTGVQ